MISEEIKALCSQIEGKNLRLEYIDHGGVLRGTEEYFNIRFYWIGKASARYHYSIKKAGMTFQGCLTAKEIKELAQEGQTVDKWNTRKTIF